MGRLDGKTVLITGGARGQGRSHAVTFGREGANVVVCDLAEDIPGLFYDMANEEDLEETRSLVEEVGGKVIALRADVRKGADLEAAVKATVDEFGALDILLANAGIVDHGSWDATDEQWDRIMDVNLKGAFLSCRAAVPQMIEQGGGSIILTASLAGVRPSGGLLPYVVSKTGVIGLMRALAIDLSQHRIRVNAVCPSAVASPMFMNEATYKIFAGGRPDATVEHARFPARTMHLYPTDWMEVEDISNAMLWLASEEARYVTGLELMVDGGASAQPPGIPNSAWTYVTPPEPATTGK